MKIGIIVYSHTGNTLSVAEKIRERLIAKGHEPEIMKVIPSNDDPKAKAPIEFDSAPGTGDYEALIFGSPVWGFSLSTMMNAYLSQLASLEGKKAGCFLTHAFPFDWMGGNSAMKQFKGICEKKGAKVSAEAIVSWSPKRREAGIVAAVDSMTKTAW